MSDDKKLKVDKDECTKCGTCIALHPEVFEFDSDGSAKVKEDADFSDKDLDEVMSVCPTSAIQKVE